MTILNSIQKVFLFTLFSAVSVYCAEAPQPDPQSWIDQLHHEDFDTRAAAVERLAAMGETARAALEKAGADKDPEIRTVVRDLLERLNRASLMIVATDRDGNSMPEAKGDVKFWSVPSDDDDLQSDPDSLTTNADGIALISGKKPGNYQINIEWKQLHPVAAFNYGGPLKLKSGPNRLPVTLTKGGIFQTTILDEQGNPIKDAKAMLSSDMELFPEQHLELQENLNDERQPSETSQVDGKIKMVGVPDGVYRCFVVGDKFETAESQLCRIHEGQVTELPPLKLKPRSSGTLSLTLSMDDGKPFDKQQVYVSLIPIVEGDETSKKMRIIQHYQALDNREPQNTDENGKLVIENIKSGKYQLSIQTIIDGDDVDMRKQTVFYQEEISIKGNETNELQLPKLTGGTLTGKVLYNKGGPVLGGGFVQAYLEQDFEFFDDMNLLLKGVDLLSDYVSRSANIGINGCYELKQLRAGKYVLTISAPQGEAAIIYGLEISEGKSVTVPDLKFPNPMTSINKINGKVLLPDGKPAIGTDLRLECQGNPRNPFGPSSLNRECDSKGVFSFNDYIDSVIGVPIRLKATLAGYITANIDLTAPDVNTDEFVIRLQKRNYGQLMVTVVDETGKPLMGAKVTPSLRPQRGGLGIEVKPASRAQRTGKNGVVRFAGLACGMRNIGAELEGYFVNMKLGVDIVPDIETPFVVVMNRGLTLTGQLDLPEGVSHALANVTLISLTSFGNLTLREAVQAQGEFSFSGLAPGDYYHIAPEAPGLLAVKSFKKFSLSVDSRESTRIKLHMVRPGGAAINVGADFAGMPATLISADFPTRINDDDANGMIFQDIVDGSGRAEFFAPPGTYRILFQYKNRYSSPDDKALSVGIISSPITLHSIKSSADLSTLQATDLKCHFGTASASFSLVPLLQGASQCEGYVTFMLLGKDVMTEFSQSYNKMVTQPIIIGTPPKLFNPIDPNRFTIEGLPAGEYKIIQTKNNRDDHENILHAENTLATFKIKDGESLALGTIKFQQPVSPKDALVETRRDEMDDEEESEDKEEMFKP